MQHKPSQHRLLDIKYIHSHITHTLKQLYFGVYKIYPYFFQAQNFHQHLNPRSPSSINQVPALSISRVLQHASTTQGSHAAWFEPHLTPEVFRNSIQAILKKNLSGFPNHELKAYTEMKLSKFSQARYVQNRSYEKKLPMKEMFGYTAIV